MVDITCHLNFVSTTQVEVNVERNPARVLKPTICSKHKGMDGPGSGLGGIVSMMPKRAVPLWRQI